MNTLSGKYSLYSFSIQFLEILCRIRGNALVSSSINMSGQDGVYANLTPDCGPKVTNAIHEIRIVSEALPTALARIFGLLSSMSVVPVSCSLRSESCTTVFLSIKLKVGCQTTIDLLVRKFSQLTETLSVMSIELNN